MVQEFVHLFRCQRRALSEMLLNPVGPVLKGERSGQMIKGILANPMNQVLRRIESRRVRWRMQELHGCVLQVSPVAEIDDFRQHCSHSGFHVWAVSTGIIQNHRDPMESQLDVAQYRHHHHEDDIVRLALGAKIGMGRASLQVHGERAVQSLTVAFITGHSRGGILRRPSVAGVGDGLQGEFIQRHEHPIRRQLGRFFNSATKSARSAGRGGP